MKMCLRLMAVALIAGAVAASGCATWLNSTRPSEKTSLAKKNGTASSEKEKPVESAKKSKTAKEPQRPPYTPPPPPDRDKGKREAIDLSQKEEINKAALKFAKNIQGVKHVKTCYSKLYGGWYLLLYVAKGKKISLQQYSWNEKNKEWEIIYHLKELPPEQLEFHLKGEVADERCFILK
jgi:hypothetical protein